MWVACGLTLVLLVLLGGMEAQMLAAETKAQLLAEKEEPPRRTSIPPGNLRGWF